MEFSKVNDSGQRQEFNTGSVRDTAEGKGIPHLIGGEALAKVIRAKYEKTPINDLYALLLEYNTVVENREEKIDKVYDALNLTIRYISDMEDKTETASIKRLAKHYENGAKKYTKNNWRKGQPVSRYYDSAFRHFLALKDGKVDEDHGAALIWNLIGIIQTKIDVSKGYILKELDDFPFLVDEVFIKPQDKK